MFVELVSIKLLELLWGVCNQHWHPVHRGPVEGLCVPLWFSTLQAFVMASWEMAFTFFDVHYKICLPRDSYYLAVWMPGEARVGLSGLTPRTLPGAPREKFWRLPA